MEELTEWIARPPPKLALRVRRPIAPHAYTFTVKNIKLMNNASHNHLQFKVLSATVI